MISGITTTCFAASYAVAFLLELARLLLRHAARRVLTLGFATAGLVAQTLYLGYWAYKGLPAAPLSSAFDWFMLAAWMLVVVYLYLTLFHPDVSYGIFILPLALALIGAAQFANHEPFPQSPAAQVWGTIHGTFWLLGAVAVIVGFVAGLMYLLQAWRLKHKLPPARGLRLPSLEWLERINGRAIVLSVLMAGIGTLSGIVLNLILHRYQRDQLPWTDPIVWQTGCMFAWFLTAALFNALYKPARRGRKVAYLTIANFVFLAIFLTLQLIATGQHNPRTRVTVNSPSAWEKLGTGTSQMVCFEASPPLRSEPVPIFSRPVPRFFVPVPCPLPPVPCPMNFQLVGCSHHNASIELRERLAFNPTQAARALDLWRERFPAAEAVLLSTCNRVEVYSASEAEAVGPNHEQVAKFLSEFHGLEPGAVGNEFFQQSGEAAVWHLFTVTASLDSLVLGEPQILAQVKQAYQLAQQHHSAGPLTHDMFQAALRVAKRVARETSLYEKRVSIPSVAIGDFARQIFDSFDDKRVLVIGAGEMGQETLRYLRDGGARDVSIVNRSAARASELAAEFSGRAAPWEELDAHLVAADLVVSTTGAQEPIVSLERFQRLEPLRYQRPLLILDLAVPRDFEPAIGDRLGVYLYSVDDLQAAASHNRQQRDAELPAALAIVEEETRLFMEQMHHRATGPIIARLRENWQSLREQELRRLFNKLPELDPKVRAEIDQAFERYANKLLHSPLEQIRDESRRGHPHGLIEALKRLFHLKD